MRLIERLLSPALARTALRVHTAIQAGRRAVDILVRTAGRRFPVVAPVLLVGFIGLFVAVRAVVWPSLVGALLPPDATVTALTPVDVLFFQIQLAAAGAALVALPPVAFLARDALAGLEIPLLRRRRRWLAPAAACLFVLGVAYAFGVVFPLLFDLFATNAQQGGFQPNYLLVEWVEFLVLYAFLFGVVAELPLVMYTLAATGIASYRRFRRRWWVSLVVAGALGAVLGRTERPLTFLAVAGALLVLYAAGLAASARVGDPSPGGRRDAEVDPDVFLTRVRAIGRRRLRGMASAFADGPVTDDEFERWIADAGAVARRLRRWAPAVLGLFAAVAGGTFLALYPDGVGLLRADLLARLPPERAAAVSVVLLKPPKAVEFSVAVALLFGVLSIPPVLLYAVWPAVTDRGLAGGDRRIFPVWGAVLVGCLAGVGTASYVWLTPEALSTLLADARGHGLELTLRLPALLWFVLYGTVGMGLVAAVPATVVLFERAGVVTYRTLVRRWRAVAFGFLVVATTAPGGMFMAFAIAVPATLTYGLGLGALRFERLVRGRRTGRPG